jgi:hypothetical protein
MGWNTEREKACCGFEGANLLTTDGTVVLFEVTQVLLALGFRQRAGSKKTSSFL